MQIGDLAKSVALESVLVRPDKRYHEDCDCRQGYRQKAECSEVSTLWRNLGLNLLPELSGWRETRPCRPHGSADAKHACDFCCALGASAKVLLKRTSLLELHFSVEICREHIVILAAMHHRTS
jgi:hypothetical protein